MSLKERLASPYERVRLRDLIFALALFSANAFVIGAACVVWIVTLAISFQRSSSKGMRRFYIGVMCVAGAILLYCIWLCLYKYWLVFYFF